MLQEVIHASSFVTEAAAFIAREAESAVARGGIFRLSLCGGQSPRPVYAELAKSSMPWDRMQITFGDERCVPPDSDQSNFRMAHQALLAHVPLAEGSIFRMRGEIDPATAADEYEHTLAVIAARHGEQRYRHDLLLLGIGDDGHTASLFPETKALEERERSVVSNFVPKLHAHRITMTFPLINAARHVCFLVSDPKKRPIVDAVLAGNREYPCGRVRPTDGQLTWLLG